MNDEAIKKNSLPADPQLNRARANIPTSDLDPAMIATIVDLSDPQEIPKLSAGEQRGGEEQAEKSGDGKTKVFRGHT